MMINIFAWSTSDVFAKMMDPSFLYQLTFWVLGLLHLRAGIIYVISPSKKDTYLSDGYSLGMTADMGAHLWWLGCMLIALAFVKDFTVRQWACGFLIIGLLVPVVTEFRNIRKDWQSTKAYPRIWIKLIFMAVAAYLIWSFRP